MTDRMIPETPSAEAYAAEADQGDVFVVNDPFALFAIWMEEASANELNDPNAMTLATVDDNGMPNARILLLKDVDACGFSFFTNTQSAKGAELAANPRASMVFHWKSIRRQVRIRGDVETVPAEAADAYFASRARGAQIGAHASAQSRPLEDRAQLESEIERFETQFGDGDVPRPGHWSGFRLVPLEIEFWVNKPFRLHDRLVYRRDDRKASWGTTRVFP